jgi:hypothetical protein
MLTQGFLGRPVLDTDLRQVGFESSPGAPVLDSHGALIGITLASTGGPATWTPLPATLPPESPAAASPPRPGLALAAPDEIYEAGLRRVLQVLAEPLP